MMDLRRGGLLSVTIIICGRIRGLAARGLVVPLHRSTGIDGFDGMVFLSFAVFLVEEFIFDDDGSDSDDAFTGFGVFFMKMIIDHNIGGVM